MPQTAEKETPGITHSTAHSITPGTAHSTTSGTDALPNVTPDALQDALNDDRRDALRQKCRAKTLRVEHAQMGTLECPCIDISRKGLKLRMAVCIPCGSEILIHPPQGVDLRVGRARIVRQHLVEDGGATWYECGIQFTEQAELRRHTWFLTLRQSAATPH